MWEPRTYDSSRFDDMIDMSLEYFGPDNDVCNVDFAKHQYFRNPSGDALIELAVDPENEVLAGQYVVQPQRFRCFGKETPCVSSTTDSISYRRSSSSLPSGHMAEQLTKDTLSFMAARTKTLIRVS